MKTTVRVVAGIFLLLLSRGVFSQQLRLGDNPFTVEKSAVLELSSTNQGLLLPRITDTAAINILNPPDGMVIYFTPDKHLLLRSNGYWRELSGATNFMTDPGANGIMVRTALNSATSRTITGTVNRISITNGDGVGGNPTIDIHSSYAGQTSITTLGTVGVGTWNGTKISEAYGGTNQTGYTLGDLLYSSATNTLSRLAGNTSATKKFLSQTGNGVNSAAPQWSTLSSSDIPDLSATYLTKSNNLSDLSSAATSRTNLGATTVGSNIFTLTNPSATGYIRVNADNTVTHRSYSNVKVDLGLDNVENTALSTWTGSTNLITLGTIGTGVWNGSIIQSGYGGTGNGFTKFTGPASTEKTFTLPNANATILTDNTAVTIAQGGTGQTTATAAFNALAPSQTSNSGKVLTTDGTNTSWANDINTVMLSSDVINNNGTANSIADVTGLSFSVTSGNTYKFKFVIAYTSAATGTGSRWSINGPANTFLYYYSNYSLTTTSITSNQGLSGYDVPAASNATSATTGSNIAIIEGMIKPSANGTVIARFASEVSSSAITAKIGSYVEYKQIN